MPESYDGEWYLGVDLGTGSCKSVVINTQGQALGFGICAYNEGKGNQQLVEQNPASLMEAMIASVRTAIDQAEVDEHACDGISLGGAFHSLMAVDRSGNPLTGLSTWVDDRAAGPAQVVREMQSAGSLYQQTGCPVHSMYPLYKLMWMRQEQRDIFRQAAQFISGKEYVLHKLTGEYLVDYGIAAGSGLLNTLHLDWNPLSLELAGISDKNLSPLYSPITVVPNLRPEMASELGIPADTPLILGSADAVNSSLGAGSVLPKRATCMVGTSGALRIIAPTPLLDEQKRSWCYAIDEAHWLVGGAINNAGLALTWFRDALNRTSIDEHEAGNLSFEKVLALAGEVPAGAGGVICLPYFAGERSPYWNMDAKGVFFGLTLQHDVRHLSRALLEGVAFRLRSLKEVLSDLGIEIEQIRASGGFTRSELWPQIVASAIGNELSIPEWGETSVLGAAFWALMGRGKVHTLEHLDRFITIEKVYQPDPKDRQDYQALYDIYTNLYHQLKGSFEQIATLTRGTHTRSE